MTVTLAHSKAWGEVAAITERFLGDQLAEPHRTMVNMIATKLTERDETIRSLREALGEIAGFGSKCIYAHDPDYRQGSHDAYAELAGIAREALERLK